MNKVQLMGRLTRDPELKATATGKSCVNFTVACDHGKDKDGNKLTNFIPCAAWDKRAEMIAKYFAKGQRILITEGELMVRNYKDPKTGENKIYTYVDVKEVEFVESKASSESHNSYMDSFAAPDVDY